MLFRKILPRTPAPRCACGANADQPYDVWQGLCRYCWGNLYRILNPPESFDKGD